MIWLAIGVAWADLPLTDLSYDVEVTGPLADVIVAQTFVNPYSTALDATYVFPLHEDAAVDGMFILVDERVIESEIHRKQDAREIFVQAKQDGKLAALTEQDRPNVFTQHVANIPPGTAIDVVLHLIQPVERVDGDWNVTLPLRVAPRFETPGAPPLPHTYGDAPEIGPGHAAHPDWTPADIDVVVRTGGMPIDRIETTGTVNHAADDALRVSETDVSPLTDWRMTWRIAADRPKGAFFVQDDHVLLTLEPPKAPPRKHVVPRELIFVVDTSGSMNRIWHLARQAMLAAIDGMDERDSFQIVAFKNVVTQFSQEPLQATETNRARARNFVTQMNPGGGTYLYDGVINALNQPRDPNRQRFVVFLTDGLISGDRQVMKEIAANADNSHVFTLGIGHAPNRYLLDEMAALGGGTASWIYPGDDPNAAVGRFLETINTPVLSDVWIDWGDWLVEEQAPQRMPPLFADQPLFLVGRVPRGGAGPVTVHGRLGDQRIAMKLHPQDATTANTRAVPVTWARRRMADLERDLLFGDDPYLDDEIVDISLGYQVLNTRTAFVAVERAGDRTQGTSPHGKPGDYGIVDDIPDHDAPPQPVARHVVRGGPPGAVETIEVFARQQAVDVEDTTRGEVLTKDFLQRVPTGRSYQTAVQMAAGVVGGGGNPNMGGAAFNENIYLLDGANITDPVTGTFSVNFDFDSVQQLELLQGAIPAYANAYGNLVNTISRSGTNNLELEMQGSLGTATENGTMGEDTASATIAGPLVRDRAWVLGSFSRQATRWTNGADGPVRDFEGYTGLGKLTVQPNAAHRFTTLYTSDPTSVDNGLLNEQVQQRADLASTRWQWFLGPDANFDTTATVQLGQTDVVDGLRDRRGRIGAQTTFSLLSVEDPFGGTHDLSSGLAGASTSWRTRDGEDALQVGGRDLSGFLQDSWSPYANTQVWFGVRLSDVQQRSEDTVVVDGTVAQPYVGVALDPFRRGRTKLTAAYGRYDDTHQLLLGGLVAAGLVPSPASPLVAEQVSGGVQHELIRDLAMGFHATLNRTRGLVERDLGQWELSMHKVEARRWSLSARYRYTWLVRPYEPVPALGPYLSITEDDDVHAVSGAIGWDLPTDPYTLTLGMVGEATSGTRLAPNAAGGADWLTARTREPAFYPRIGPGWSLGFRVAQRFDLRKGALTARFDVRNVSGLDATPGQLVQAGNQVFVQGGWDPMRVDGGLEYEF